MTGLAAVLAGLNGAAMVALGAYGAHGLATVDPAYRAIYQTGWQIHAAHAAFLLAVALCGQRSRWLDAAFWLGLLGTALFCVPLYGPALGWWTSGGFVPPLGGLTLMAAWLALVPAGLARIRERRRRHGQ